MALENWMVERYQNWLKQAQNAGEAEPTSMTVATLREDGAPSVRTVLLKRIDTDGLVFFTNLESIKGRQLQYDPRIAVCQLWKSIYRQIVIEGRAELISEEEADAYFATRDRMSQLGAWASKQSRPLDSRETLERRVHEMEERYAGKDVPRPAHWSGFRIVPELIEFWQGGDYRLHDRFRYSWQDGSWQEQRLYP